MSLYADSSVFVSLYLRDAHFAVANRGAHGKQLWLTSLHRVEWNHAIAQHMFRGILSDQEARKIYAAFETDRQSGVWLDVDLPENVFQTAIQLARKHVARLGGRTLDTLHVASALELGAHEFWSFDSRQLTLARAAGLKSH